MIAWSKGFSLESSLHHTVHKLGALHSLPVSLSKFVATGQKHSTGRENRLTIRFVSGD